MLTITKYSNYSFMYMSRHFSRFENLYRLLNAENNIREEKTETKKRIGRIYGVN